ncbi:MAG TPA: ATP-binding protein [Anaerolineae bacterium]|nr:ATP-binding protein [Anaerolineae bacterium]HQH39998.1 ATP-binding protein [Anaerolineae bacterium]
MNAPIKILLIEDEPAHIALIQRAFETRAAGTSLIVAHTLAEGRAYFTTEAIDLVIVDWLLPDGHGTDVLPATEALASFPVIVMTSHGNEQIAVEALKAGALDYVVKSAETLADMPHIVERALREWRYSVERRQAAQEIARLQQLLQKITDSMPSALITLDTQGRILTWNPAAENLTHCNGATLYGCILWEKCPVLSRYRPLVDEVLRTHEVTHRPREMVHTADGTFYYDVHIFPLLADTLTGVVLHIEDVTQRVYLEETMFQTTKMASIGRLAAGMAHEINNPLGAMMQAAQMLQLALDTHEPRNRARIEAAGIDPACLEAYLRERKLLEYAQGIRDMGERAAKIVSDLLGFSRKGTSTPGPYDMNTLILQTLDLATADYNLKKQFDFRDIELVYDFAPNLPPVIGDSQQIQQVVLNLVRNAVQAMAEKSAAGLPGYRARLTIHTSAVDPHHIRVEIEDNGPGISETVRQRLFEPFFTTKDVGEGSGLGLWLCWSIIVERHSGRIWTEPAQGAGTRFIFELPVNP